MPRSRARARGVGGGSSCEHGKQRYTCKERSETGTSFAASPSSSSVFLAKIGPHENNRRKVSMCVDGREAGAAQGAAAAGGTRGGCRSFLGVASRADTKKHNTKRLAQPRSQVRRN